MLVSEEVNLNEVLFLPDSLLRVFRGVLFEISKHALKTPLYAYDKARKQYNSTLLLEHLAAVKPKGYGKCLGIFNVDIYARGLNFVFGEAIPNGGEALISLYRLRPEFYGDPPDEKLFRARVVKEAVHELGHAFGLTHCINSECVMHFSNSIIDTDFKSIQPCLACQTKLLSRLV
ncbi:MAG: archaemetzincin family Zn-dependent metalloprotease [Thermoproteota archaeon]